MVIVVEGVGQWTYQEYFPALRDLRTQGDEVFFTFDSTFGLDDPKLDEGTYCQALNTLLERVRAIRREQFACIDVKDTIYRLRGQSDSGADRRKLLKGRENLPPVADAVFVVTPDRTHCEIVKYWKDRAKRIFVEKPFSSEARLIDQLIADFQSEPSYTQVYALDHYLIRSDVAAAQYEMFLKYLIDWDAYGERVEVIPSPIESFEFCMTEGPEMEHGIYTNATMARRVASVQKGIVFDMGAHGLPMMIPFLGLERPYKFLKVWAGVSEGLQSILYQGAESFSIAEVVWPATETGHEFLNGEIRGRFIVGKDIGDPKKYLLVRGKDRAVRFDINERKVFLEDLAGARIEEIVSLDPSWARTLVSKVKEATRVEEDYTDFKGEERLPDSVLQFRPSGAHQVVTFLEQWRRFCDRTTSTGNDPLPAYEPGSTVDQLETAIYECSNQDELEERNE